MSIVSAKMKPINERKVDLDMPIVVVTMSTGLQGNALIHHLSKTNKFKIRALTRDVSSKSALKLLNYPNVQLVKADFLNKDSLENSFMDAYAIFGNTTPTKGWRLFRGSMVRDYEMKQGENLIKAVRSVMKKGRLKHFIFSSVCHGLKQGLDNTIKVPSHFSSKWEIEAMINQAGLDNLTTIIRPCSYFENFYSDLPGIQISPYIFPGVVKPESLWQTIAVEDIGAWATAILMNPDRFLGEKLNLAGESLTGNQMTKILNGLLAREGKKANYFMLPRPLLNLLEHDIAVMADWIENSGYAANIPELRKLSNDLGLEITSLYSWLKSKLYMSPVFSN